VRLILASKSPARLSTLTAAGLHPVVMVSDVDEAEHSHAQPTELVAALATAKARDVEQRLRARYPSGDETVIIIGCDSMLEFDSQALGKPGTRQAAIDSWHRLRGREGVLHTGHHVIVLPGSADPRTATRVASTTITFADLSDEEIVSYADTGEPQHVAGGFTIDGLGGAFITRIVGDPHNVVGISLPLVRQMLVDLGVQWVDLWADRNPSG